MSTYNLNGYYAGYGVVFSQNNRRAHGVIVGFIPSERRLIIKHNVDYVDCLTPTSSWRGDDGVSPFTPEDGAKYITRLCTNIYVRHSNSDEESACPDCGQVTHLVIWHDEDEEDVISVCPDCLLDNYLICPSCNHLREKATMEVVNDTAYCSQCFAAFPRCSQCGTMITNAYSGYTLLDGTINPSTPVRLCSDCFIDAHSVECSRCNRHFTRLANNRRRMCQECLDEEAEENRSWNTRIHGYHERPRYHMCGSRRNSLKLGVEVEVDDGNNRNACAAKALGLTNDLYANTDGSLNCGFEIISHPATLNYHMTKIPWAKVLDIVKEYGFDADGTNTCGLHVHVSRKFFGETNTDQNLQIMKLIMLVSRFWDSHITTFARRESDRWAGRNTCCDEVTYLETRESLLEKYCDDSRYRAINLTNSNTVEFRMFKGTVDYTILMATLQFVDGICRAAKNIKFKDLNNAKWEDVLPDPLPSELKRYLRTLHFPNIQPREVVSMKPVKKTIEPLIPIGAKVEFKSWDELVAEGWETFAHPRLGEDVLLTDQYFYTHDFDKYVGNVYTVRDSRFDTTVFLSDFPESDNLAVSMCMLKVISDNAPKQDDEEVPEITLDI